VRRLCRFLLEHPHPVKDIRIQYADDKSHDIGDLIIITEKKRHQDVCRMRPVRETFENPQHKVVHNQGDQKVRPADNAELEKLMEFPVEFCII